jgi:hypothetical protein
MIDVHAWAETQAALAREGRATALDLPRLADELDDWVADGVARVEILAMRIMQHLLYLERPPGQDPRQGLEDGLDEAQAQLALALGRSKRLRQHLVDHLDDAYARARRLAERRLIRHGEAEAAAQLPKVRPYGLDVVLGEEGDAGA